MQTQKLGTGEVTVFELPGEVKVHSFNINDPLGDYVQLIETKDGLIGIDMPAFQNNFTEWGAYIDSLKKPMKTILISNHANDTGQPWRQKAKVASTQAVKGQVSGGVTKAISDGLHQNFGDQFVGKLAEIDTIIPEGKQTIDGLDVEIQPDGAGILIELPVQKAAFMHMLGADTHSIVPSPEAADAAIANLNKLGQDGIEIIFTTHHAPEKAEALGQKVEYLQNVKEIAKKSPDAASFKQNMQNKYPNMQGGPYLDMTTNALYPAK